MAQEPVVSRRWIRELTRGELPVVLMAAIVQGWCLYALHRSIDNAAWPATDPGWLAGLYAVALFVVVTVQRLAPHVRQPLMWLTVAALAGFYLLIGWHYGAWILEEPLRRGPDEWAGLAVILGLQWLLVMPFLQARLLEGRWRCRYELLFGSAWNNHLVLAEAVAFTGLFWLLLALWAQLFEMLGIRFFIELFQKPIFVYPVTSLVFGVALQLIGSLERLTKVLLEQALNVLKWLALLVGLILGLFTVALLLKLPGMVASGEKAIAASWLLWLVAVTVLLINAAYRDGTVETPYPRAVGIALRWVIPFTLVIALTAIYALSLRIDQYGVTVARFWACVVAGAALLYSAGYAFAVRDKSHWMGGIARVNVGVALYLIAVITLALTPVLSPYRLASDSQFALAQAIPGTTADAGYKGATPFHYLRFDAGKYGKRRLEELSRIENHPRATEIREQALAALALTNRGDLRPVYGASKFMAKLVLQPSGRTLDSQLIELMRSDVFGDPETIAGVFVDLNGDAAEEFVLLYSGTGTMYGRKGDGWYRVGAVVPEQSNSQRRETPLVTEDNFKAVPAAWSDLMIGSVRYRLLEYDR